MRKLPLSVHAATAGRADRRRRGAPRLSCPCCAQADPDRPRPSVRLANWLARAASHAAAGDLADSPVSTASPFEDPSK
jgi:hypothetical protein